MHNKWNDIWKTIRLRRNHGLISRVKWSSCFPRRTLRRKMCTLPSSCQPLLMLMPQLRARSHTQSKTESGSGKTSFFPALNITTNVSGIQSKAWGMCPWIRQLKVKVEYSKAILPNMLNISFRSITQQVFDKSSSYNPKCFTFFLAVGNLQCHQHLWTGSPRCSISTPLYHQWL